MKEVDKIIYRGNDTYTKVYQGDTLEYQKKIDYLSFTALENSSVGTSITGTVSPKPNVEYSKDKTNWFDLTTTTVALNAGETIYIRGNNPNSFSIDANNYLKFTMTGNIKAGGSIATLINQTGYNSTIPTNAYFLGLFKDCSGLKNVDNLLLMDATGKNNCYAYFFVKTGLSTVPDNLIENCGLSEQMFNSCFRECSSLTKAPRLPKGSIIPKECFANMFNRCSVLTDISNIDLSFDEIGEGGCLQMFYYCSVLKAAPELPATTIGVNCYRSMFLNCTALKAAPELPATTLADYCYCDMLSGCTNLETAPVLPAKILTTYCYRHLFVGCSKINYVKCLAEDISADSCTQDWLFNAPSTGTFVKSSNMTGWTTGTSGIPTGWTVENE